MEKKQFQAQKSFQTRRQKTCINVFQYDSPGGYILEGASPMEVGGERLDACIEEVRFFGLGGFMHAGDAPRAGAVDLECC